MNVTPTLHFIHNLRNYPNFLRFLTPKNIAWVYLRKNCLKKVLLYLLGSLEICYGHYFSLSWHFVLTIFHVPERSFRGERSFTYSLASLIRFTSLRSVKNCEPLLNPYFAACIILQQPKSSNNVFFCIITSLRTQSTSLPPQGMAWIVNLPFFWSWIVNLRFFWSWIVN